MKRLNRVREGKREYERMLHRVEELEALATRSTPVLSAVPKGDSNSLKDDAWATLIDYKAKCVDKLKEYLRDCDELEEELMVIRSTNIRTAMKYYYIDCMRQDEIAVAMCYSDREIRYYLQKGRKIYAEKYGTVES